jgi:hypothetical protein
MPEIRQPSLPRSSLGFTAEDESTRGTAGGKGQGIWARNGSIGGLEGGRWISASGRASFRPCYCFRGSSGSASWPVF